MPTGRHPRPDADDLAVTHDELEPVRTTHDEPPEHLAIGSGDHASVERARLDADFYDREPRTRDLEARVTALELGARRKSRIRAWIERGVSFLGGSALVALTWALTKADANGEARATARAREATFQWLVDTVRALDRHDAAQQGQIDTINDRLRYPMHGPPTAPRTSP